MHSKQFMSSKQLLTKKVNESLIAIDKLNVNSLDARTQFREHCLKLEALIKDPEYPKLSMVLQEKVSNLLLIKDLHPLSGDQIIDLDFQPNEPMDVFLQLPSKKHRVRMAKMPAGGDEDQAERLENMTQIIREHCDSRIPIIDTEQLTLPEYWEQLFAAISKGNKINASLRTIPPQDKLLQALLAVHSEEYVQQVIHACIAAHKTGKYKLSADIIITPMTFEILIRDIATSLMYPGKCIISLGLPTHHAYPEEGKGFCIFNKTAVLLLTQRKSIHYVIIGTDINRDDGLCNTLREKGAQFSICHVDIFDSRVYPQHDAERVKQEFNDSGHLLEDTTFPYWYAGDYYYYPVDLSTCKRTANELHPALQFALNSLEENIECAKNVEEQIVLYLPIGWDSHQEETAYCGIYVNNKKMSKAAAKVSRFSDEDLSTFYRAVFTLYQENKECFAQIYWGLEGGYEPVMYAKQIELFLSTASQYLFEPQNASSLSM